MLPKDVNDVTFAFPANVDEYLPKMEDIPQEYCSRNSKSKWVPLFNILFYGGETDKMWITSKEGIDAGKAGRHIMCIMKSYQPKHEHKLAGVLYLMDMWFEDWGITES
jgi:hypothetical protein